MKELKLRYIDRFLDRNKKMRFYFRRGKEKRIPLPGRPGEPAFMTAYAVALNPPQGSAPEPPKPAPAMAGSFRAMVDAYYVSDVFTTIKRTTQAVYRRVIENWLKAEKIASRSVAGMNREHVNLMLAKRAATPGAANDLLKKIKLLMTFAILNGYRTDDPTLKMKKHKGGEFHTWTDREVATFEKRWPVGTRERLVFDLLIYTGQRVSDVATMLWNDVSDDGMIEVVQQKTGTKLAIALHRNLNASLRLARRTGPAIVITQLGDGFSAKGLSNWMAETIGQAGLPERCVTHGIRKAAARRLAEVGCSAKQIAAITGHKSLEEVERYVRAAEQKRLARSAIRLLTDGEDCQTAA